MNVPKFALHSAECTDALTLRGVLMAPCAPGRIPLRMAYASYWDANTISTFLHVRPKSSRDANALRPNSAYASHTQHHETAGIPPYPENSQERPRDANAPRRIPHLHPANRQRSQPSRQLDTHRSSRRVSFRTSQSEEPANYQNHIGSTVNHSYLTTEHAE